MRITKNIIHLFLGIFLVFVLSGCLPNDKELQFMLIRNDITKNIYIKNDTNVYDGYGNERKVLTTLKRGDEYEVIDIKNDFARLVKTNSNELKDDMWISLAEVEIKPTYFVTLIVDAPNAKVLLNDKEYKLDERLPKGNYKVEISAKNYLDKTLEIEVNEDLKKEIILDFDEELEKQRLEKQRLEKEKIKREKLKKERIKKEIEREIYIDKEQKLMWQDNSSVIEVKKVWLTQTNFDDKKYNNTDGDTASAYCKKLVIANLKGWRLPTKDELKNLFTQKENLKNTSSNWYWSSTSSPTYDERAWSIYFDNGDGYTDFKNNGNFVRCVRAGR